VNFEKPKRLHAMMDDRLAYRLEDVPWFQPVLEDSKRHLRDLYAYDPALCPAWYRKWREEGADGF
jgi:hypothetical protein